MSSQYTTSLQIQKIGNGEQSGIWGSTTNTNWDLIEQAVAGVRTITMSNSNYTLTALNGLSDEARNMVLIVQGTNNTTYQVIAPLVSKMYVVTNNTSGGNAITIGASTGSIISIPNGITAQVYCDGSTGFYSAQTGSAGNFTVNGNFYVTGNISDVGTLSGTTISASNQFSGPGTGLTGTATSLSIGGSAATATTATNIAGGTANSIVYQSGSATTSFVAPPSTANTALVWSGSNFTWGNITSTSGSGCVYENGQTITSNYTMTSGNNGVTAGPVTVATGITVTIPTGSRWVIV